MINRVPVAILGATGMVGQQFLALLQNHPFFVPKMLAASEQSAGKRYGEVVRWKMAVPLSLEMQEQMVVCCLPHPEISVVFSALEGEAAYAIEKGFAEAGCWVFSSTKAFRMHEAVPLLVPEVNPSHLALLDQQPWKGRLLTHPNCIVAGLAPALQSLHTAFGLRAMHLVTMQSTSGAGYPGVSNLDILDNLIPYIAEEEEKIPRELHKILGTWDGTKIQPAAFAVSAQCHRVPIREGHFAAVSVSLERKASLAECLEAWKAEAGLEGVPSLPSAPKKVLSYWKGCDEPQPKLCLSHEKGMQIHLGRLQECSVLDLKFTLLSHNLLRGGAGGTLLMAERMYSQITSKFGWGALPPVPSSRVSAATPFLSISRE